MYKTYRFFNIINKIEMFSLKRSVKSWKSIIGKYVD